jgi:hypothetical protein
MMTTRVAADIDLLLATVDKLATDRHGPIRELVSGLRHQRWISLHDLRQAVDLPSYRVDTALRGLAKEYRVWLRWADRNTSLDEDNAALRIGGQDFHDITADPWR